jgi:hypothetical protein
MDYEFSLKIIKFNSNEKFLTSENLQRYGYIPQKKSAENPDGLPVGFTKDGLPENPRVGAKLGVTCAACHMADITYGRKTIRIDGGQSYSDFQSFLTDMDKSAYATYTDPIKLKGFIDEILGDKREDPVLRAKVKFKLGEVIQQRKEWNERNRSNLVHGYGRTDAVGVILNQVTAWDMHNSNNAQPPDAPVSYPFIWNASQLEIAQYIPLSRNAERGGPLGRNIGEVLGVFGVTNLFDPTKILNGACSSVKRSNLEKIETNIGKLWSPTWPEAVLGQINHTRAESGAQIYKNNCLSCHAILPYNDTSTPIKANFTPLKDIGTDSAVIDLGVVRLAETGPFKGKKSEIIEGFKLTESEPAAVLLRFAVVATILGTDSRLQCGVNDDTTWSQSFNRYFAIAKKVFSNIAKPKPQHTPVVDRETRIKNTIEEYSKYKARPLNGIWSTAPYLHNGSVKNLYELFLTPDMRSKVSKTFTVGCTEFDPVNVGIECDSEQGRGSSGNKELKVFDTTLKGNSNSGHLYGTDLSEDEKMDLVEYLKTL